MLNIDFVRAQFPAFSEPSLTGQAFFENAGGSYTCGQVIDRLTRFYTARKVQPYGPYGPSRLGGEEMDEARDRMAAILGVESDELSFGPSTSQNSYVLAQAFRRFLPKGAAIVVTNQDHEANTGVWRRLAEDGIEVREWRMDPATGHLDPDALAPLLDDASLLCFPHCSNVIGEINDVAAITQMAHAAGAYTCVDGVSYAPHGFPDVGALGADIYLFSAYKTYGPHQGLMVVRRALADLLPNQGHHFNGGVRTKRFTPAGPDHAQVAASAGMADYVDALFDHLDGAAASPAQRGAVVHDAMRAREEMLMAPLLDYLQVKNSVRLLGPARAAARAPTLALEAARPGAELAARLAPLGINAAGGDFYAGRALEGVGVDPARGVLRLSFTHYTSEAEISALIDALDRVV
ncbi:MAG: aminotransferase class V-fold PLP-dependent enzyme [Silicimonas sp.]|nr:aminotransferase class V-fold PLP-dependent enzyme [Silicimonas sp.]